MYNNDKNEHYGIINETLKLFVSSEAEILKVEEQAIAKGFSAEDIVRHKIIIMDNKEEKVITFITKRSTLIERRVLSRLYKQSANVPFNFSYNYESDEPSTIYMQDIDFDTDYSKLNIEKILRSEYKLLAHIHSKNYGLKDDLAWLPVADRVYIIKMLDERWKPFWDKALENEQFLETFAAYIPEIKAVAALIIDDMEIVINDESSHTLIHTDMHPGNVLVGSNDDLYFIDWEEAHYGSFYFDIPLRFNTYEKAEKYRQELVLQGIEIQQNYFAERYKVASRYIGLRYMAWTLGSWENNHHSLESLQSYINMIVGKDI
ncbi:phosphotransferase family protein [Paenibacillus eucommiae]|uniref:tRNA A-37 threonylcarbamoyl transferase component Bud32 n=1 Tax=Paenibacillus eucommiae TaxID=1355755 RepID=A0ABS4IZK9_9BACL|nr:aminoglycoside phosphotransferase family protein [Paenibacillus eucommiae]MBP1993024.1 tRNA A-37 threonylcarbamoyl transferase component Bud32 [Paenibacillus eucommiae]